MIRGDSAEILNILKTGLSEEAMDDTVDIDFQEEGNVYKLYITGVNLNLSL